MGTALLEAPMQAQSRLAQRRATPTRRLSVRVSVTHDVVTVRATGTIWTSTRSPVCVNVWLATSSQTSGWSRRLPRLMNRQYVRPGGRVPRVSCVLSRPSGR